MDDKQTPDAGVEPKTGIDAVPAPNSHEPGSAINPGEGTPQATMQSPEPMVQSQAAPPQQAVPGAGGKSRAPLFAGLMALVLAMVGGGAFYAFGYLPNTPENVWRRGLASIGVGLEELSEDQELFTAEATQFNGELNIQKPLAFTATVEGTAGLVSGTGETSIKASWEGYSPELDVQYSLLDGTYPQLFFRFDGIRELVDGNLGAGAFADVTGGQTIENVWWLLDFKELVDRGLIDLEELEQAFDEVNVEGQLTATDLGKLSQAVIDASNEYIFTANVEDMVLQIEEELGTEEYEGVDSRKYLVEIDKDNLKKYVKTVRDNVIATGIVERISPEIDVTEEVSDEDIDREVNDLDFSDVKIEAWVGLNNKVLRNLRFTPIENTAYIDVSLLLEDDTLDQIPLRLKVVGSDDESTGSYEINWIANLKENSAEITMKADIDYTAQFEQDLFFDGRFTFKDLEKEPKFETPTPSQSFIDFIEDLSASGSSVLGDTTDSFGL